MSFHTWITGNGGRMTKNEPVKVYEKLSNNACLLAVSDDYGGGSGLQRAGAGRGKSGGSFRTGFA
ncbi:unnamed protein product [Prunus armeniaca]